MYAQNVISDGAVCGVGIRTGKIPFIYIAEINSVFALPFIFLSLRCYHNHISLEFIIGPFCIYMDVFACVCTAVCAFTNRPTRMLCGPLSYRTHML